MTDFARARRMMVEGQIRTNDVTDLRVLAAFEAVPRERFVPPDKQALAYVDRDISVGGGSGPAQRYLLKPMVLAKLVQMADVRETDKALDVGCATGYSSAILAHLASSVTALEEDAALAKFAGEALAGNANAHVASGPLVAGWPSQAPYDVILLNGSVEVVPDDLLKQLNDGGRLVGIVGRAPIGKAMVYRRAGTHVSVHPVFDAVAPLVPGFAKPPQFVF